MARLTGDVTIGEVTHRITDGTLRIRLIDVSRADAAAVVIAEKTIPGLTIEPGDESITFDLDIPMLEPRSTYAIEAHLDADGSGETSVGDYRTMEHIAVTPGATDISVPIRPVG
ncbi:MAG: YbaY family lipoprotein [Acidimicrobiia bacterium]